MQRGVGMRPYRKSVYAWALYDWANSAYATTVMAGFFPLFFKSYYSVDADVTLSSAQLGFANSLSSLLLVLVAPLLGAMADAASLKKRFLFLFAYLGILMSGALALVDEGEWQLASFLYILGNIGFMGSNTFYDSLLHQVSNRKNVNFVSALGFALGYLGGGILFALNVWMVQEYSFFGFADKAEAIKVSFISVALWWSIFSIPLLLFVQEPQTKNPQTIALKEGYARVKKTFLKIKNLKHISLFLLAYWLYIDGVDTIIRMAVDYAMALGFDSSSLIMALLLVQFVGFPATIFFTKLTLFMDTKKSIYLAIGVYLVITLWASMMQDVYEFYVLAFLIALVQGGIQALSRSYYARMVPKEYAAEFFGFYNLIGKFAAIFGPLLMAFVVLFSQSSRLSIASLSLLFVVGGVLLYFVDEDKGRSELSEALTKSS